MGIYCFMCLLWFIRGTQCRSFCGRRTHPIVNICTDHLVEQSNYILIDTASVPDFQQTSCECVILTNKQELGITLMLENFTQVFNMEFEIKETVINKIKYNYDTTIKSGTKISFSTHENHQRDGACLGVFSNDQTKFNITCGRSIINSNPDKESEGNENTSTVPAALATLTLVCCLAIAVIFAICYRRRQAERVIKQETKPSVNTRTEGDNYMTDSQRCNNGQNSGTVTQNEHSAAIVSGHYECIKETADENHSSEHSPKHPVSYNYLEHPPTGVKIGAANNKNINDDIDGERDLSSLKADDQTVYDCTNVTSPQKATGHNDYDHLSTIGPNEQCAFGLYDKVEQKTE